MRAAGSHSHNAARSRREEKPIALTSHDSLPRSPLCCSALLVICSADGEKPFVPIFGEQLMDGSGGDRQVADSGRAEASRSVRLIRVSAASLLSAFCCPVAATSITGLRFIVVRQRLHDTPRLRTSSLCLCMTTGCMRTTSIARSSARLLQFRASCCPLSRRSASV